MKLLTSVNIAVFLLPSLTEKERSDILNPFKVTYLKPSGKNNWIFQQNKMKIFKNTNETKEKISLILEPNQQEEKFSPTLHKL